MSSREGGGGGRGRGSGGRDGGGRGYGGRGFSDGGGRGRGDGGRGGRGDGGRGGRGDGGRGGRGDGGRGGRGDGGRGGRGDGGRGGRGQAQNVAIPTGPPPVPVKSTLLKPLVNTLFPSRPGFGKFGTPVTIWANHYAVRLNPNQGDVFHYDVSIVPEGKPASTNTPAKELTAAVLQSLLQLLKTEYPTHTVVSDGRRNLYAATLLPFDQKVFQVSRAKVGGRTEIFDAHVTAATPVAVRLDQLSQLFAGRLNYTPYDAIQALDIAMRYSASTRFTTVGRNFFNNMGAVSLGEGAELWFGYHQSLRPTQSQLTLNVDMAATAFVEAMPALDYLVETCRLQDVPATLSKFQIADANKAFRGVKIKVTHRGTVDRAYRVNGLKKSARETTMEVEGGRRITIEKYFAEHYRPLRYPNLPLLHVGSPTNTIYMPMEVCNIVGGYKCPRKATDTQVANMILHTATNPEVRRQKIEARVRDAHFSGDQCLQAFGLTVDPKLLAVEGRVLRAPGVLYGRGKTEQPRDGAWNMRNLELFQGMALDSYAILSLCDSRRTSNDDILDFFHALVDHMKSLGMKPPSGRPPLLVRQGRQQPIESMFGEAVNQAKTAFGVNPQVIFCVSPVADAANYGELKIASDVTFGIPSQMMLAKHLLKKNPMYMSNLLLKVNTKLGGRNAVCKDPLPKIGSQATIIFGADVTHPGAMDKSRPSVAAVVASMDRWGVRHAASIRKQGHRVEQIEDLESMAAEMLKAFFIETKRKPSQILFYRDGVSEGQYQMVLNFEVSALRQACAKLEPGYAPKISFVIVGKRHHTRLFPTSASTADRSGNVKAGTVVDTGICHPTEHDFYLMSHAGLQGTSRPAHYHVLLDEIGFTADELQALSFNLTHTYARCTRSVSLVPSVYYAHLLAFRARYFLLDGSDQGSSATTASSFSGRMLDAHVALKNVMYYV
ncbi:hypothetical protein LEN26_009490 [Aphanomyces euteiches]|nr:hypothetical protein LEN26_009490 [Aphanomyces euteiches]